MLYLFVLSYIITVRYMVKHGGIFNNKVVMLIQVMFAGMTEIQLVVGHSWRVLLNIIVIG